MTYDFETPRFWAPPTEDPAVLAAGLRSLGPRHGERFLYLDVRARHLGYGWSSTANDELWKYLLAFPREKLPHLERRFAARSLGTELEVRAAWLMTLVP